MSQIDRRSLVALFGTSLLAGPAFAQTASVAPADFKGKVFVTGHCQRKNPVAADRQGR
jgi:hypothetical protein